MRNHGHVRQAMPSNEGRPRIDHVQGKAGDFGNSRNTTNLRHPWAAKEFPMLTAVPPFVLRVPPDKVKPALAWRMSA